MVWAEGVVLGEAEADPSMIGKRSVWKTGRKVRDRPAVSTGNEDVGGGHDF